MKKILICLFSVFFVLLLVGCGKQEPPRTSKLEVGKTYAAVDPITLLDEKHFVRLHSRANYDTEEELAEAEEGKFYPYIYFQEGYYEKHGKDYHFIVTRSVRVTFKNVANIKKIISKIELNDNPNPEKKYMLLNYDDGYYRVNDNQPVFDSDEKIPESIEDSLAQYEYVPEELE